MKISKEQLEKFKLLYKQKFGIELDDIRAIDHANKLVNLMKIVSRYNDSTYRDQ